MDLDSRQEEAAIRQLCHEFKIGHYRSHSAVKRGNTRNLRLITSEGAYFLKPSLAPEELTLYSQVEQRLNQTGVRQPRLYRNGTGEVISATGFAVFEFLKGETHQKLNAAQINSLVKLLADYSVALAQINSSSFVAACNNPWRKAASLNYVTHTLANHLEKVDLRDDVRRVIYDSIAIMVDEQPQLESAPQQLVHSDVGPDNVLFDGDVALAIVDFTPDVAPELYAVCQFLYWQVLWSNEFGLDHERIRFCLELYRQCRGWNCIDAVLFRGLLIKAAMFRLVGPLLATLEQEQMYSAEGLDRRAKLLRLVIEDAQLRTTDWLKTAVE